jgi:methyltransferase (TIGR00027 family)
MNSIESDQSAPSPNMSHVAETCLLTFYCHAIESQSTDPILHDEKAVEITGRINPLLAGSNSKLLRSLSLGKLKQELIVHIALRARKYDEYAREFITRHPDGIIVNIGCGMDSRFHRIDDGRLTFFDLDLPEVIEFKRQYYQESKRYKMLPYSVFDYKWMDAVKEPGDRPVLFLAEGVFMYLEADKVKALVLELQKRFPGSELACEVVNQRWLSPIMKKMLRAKLRRGVNIGEDADYHFGIRDSRDMETWNPGIQLLDDWCYFETNHVKLGWLRLFRKNKLFLRTQWTVHYLLK